MFLQFEFLAMLNLFVLLLWPTFEMSPSRKNVLNIILVIVSIFAVVLDIVFLVLKGTGHA